MIRVRKITGLDGRAWRGLQEMWPSMPSFAMATGPVDELATWLREYRREDPFPAHPRPRLSVDEWDQRIILPASRGDRALVLGNLETFIDFGPGGSEEAAEVFGWEVGEIPNGPLAHMSDGQKLGMRDMLAALVGEPVILAG